MRSKEAAEAPRHLVSFHMPEDEWVAFKAMAEAEQRSVASLARKAVRSLMHRRDMGLDVDVDERTAMSVALAAEAKAGEYRGVMNRAWRSLARSFRRLAGQSELEVMRAVPLEPPAKERKRL